MKSGLSLYPPRIPSQKSSSEASDSTVWVLAYENQGAEAPKSVQALRKVRLFMVEN